MNFSDFSLCKPVKKNDVFVSELKNSPVFRLRSSHLTLKEYPLRVCIHDFDMKMLLPFTRECAMKLSEDLVVWFGAESSVEDLLQTIVFDHNFDDPNVFELIVKESCYENLKHILKSSHNVFMNQQLSGKLEFVFPEIHFFQDKAMFTGFCCGIELNHDDENNEIEEVPQPFSDDISMIETQTSLLLRKKQQELEQLSKMEQEMQNKIKEVNSKKEALTFEMNKISSLKRTT